MALLLLRLLLLTVGALATCYYENGTLATDDVSCGFGSNYCCPQGNTCVTNGLCQDKNNHDDGSLTYFTGKADPGPYNYTGLYRASSCQDPTWKNGCPAYCITGGAAGDAYLWACNDATTQLCCHNDGVPLSQGDCCSQILFTLSSRPVALNRVASTQGSAQTTQGFLGSSIATRTVVQTTSPSAGISSTAGDFTSTATASDGNVVTVTVVATAPPTIGPMPANGASATSLSTGALAGIIVGVVVGVLLALTLAIFAILRWRRRRQNEETAASTGAGDQPAGERSTYTETRQSQVNPLVGRQAIQTPQMMKTGDVYR